MVSENVQDNKRGLTKCVSPLGALALSLGTSIGWGSLVVTCNAYLSQAGIMGSVFGMIIGAVIMIVISRNYHYMITSYPDAGGAYAFVKEVYGYDHGFLTAWFLALTYLSIFWANVTSMPLFAHYFFGDMFRFGYLYTIFDYKVYLGETLLACAAIALTALVCIRFKKSILNIMIGLVLLFTAAITICFIVAVVKHTGGTYSYEPHFAPDKSSLSQIIKIACISPWAFIGFENISHTSEEFTFARSKVFRLLICAVIATAALYIFIMLLSVSAYPPEYSSWMEYINDLGNIDGIKGLPAFYAAGVYLGDTGVYMLFAALFALIVTSLFGNVLALSRLFYALGKDKVIPEKFGELNKKNNPGKAIILVAAVSILIPLLGRTTIGWIVDVTTIGATIIYGFVASAAFKAAKQRGDKADSAAGLAGLVLMIGVGLSLMLPNLLSEGTMEKETYFLFTVWAILGFIYFRYILSSDKTKRFGKSTVVWIGLLALILFTSMVWLSRSTMTSTNETMTRVQTYYNSISGAAGNAHEEQQFMAKEMHDLRGSNMRNMITVIGFFAISMSIMLSNYSLMRKRAQKSEELLVHATNKVNIDSMTGVKSKHAFIEREIDIDEQIHHGKMEKFAIAVCDVNGLKYINDNFGHKAGDKYIRDACKVVCEHFAHSPVYRVGGDEFTVILTGRDYENREEIMARFNSVIEQGLQNDGVVISAGISEFNAAEDVNTHAVFERADAEMYNRKKQLKEMGARSRG